MESYHDDSIVRREEELSIEMMRLRQIKGRLRQIENGRQRQIEMMRLRRIEKRLRRIESRRRRLTMWRLCLFRFQIEEERECLLQIERRCTTDQPLKTEVYYRPWTRKRDPDCDPSNRIIDIISQASTVVIIVAYDVKGEGSGSVESECRDAEGGEGSRSGANEGSSSGESQGQDSGEGSASGENQGGDRNAEGSGSNDDEDERERQGRVGGDIEQGIQENNQEEIDFSGTAEAFLAIIGATSIAAVEFHNGGAISSTTLGRLIATGVVGFLCCMASMLKRSRRPKVARILGTIGAAAGGLEFLLLVSENFSSYYGWMILGLGSLAILFICVWAFRR